MSKTENNYDEHKISGTAKYHGNLCTRGQSLYTWKMDPIAAETRLNLPDYNKLVGAVFSPVTLQVNWISKIIAF